VEIGLGNNSIRECYLVIRETDNGMGNEEKN
jgi:hypothetical protein